MLRTPLLRTSSLTKCRSASTRRTLSTTTPAPSLQLKNLVNGRLAPTLSQAEGRRSPQSPHRAQKHSIPHTLSAVNRYRNSSTHHLLKASYATSGVDTTDYPDEAGEMESDAYGGAAGGDSIYEAESEFGAESDDHLRVNLYPSDSDPVLTNLFNAGTLQEIFDIFSSVPTEARDEKHASQALTSVCNLQKYMYKISSEMDPEKDTEHRAMFIEKVREHPTFGEVVQLIVTKCEALDDEPLAASLLGLKRLGFRMTAPECQELLQECRHRKSSLGLPALSRLTVCVRSESCALILYEFLPALLRYVEAMDSDLAVRLASISIKNIKYNVSSRMSRAYRQQVGKLLQDKSIEMEGITLCKVLLCLFETSVTESTEDHDREDRQQPVPSTISLIRIVGTLLSQKLNDLDVLDLMILQRYVEHGPKEPRALIDALNAWSQRLIKEHDNTPVIELLQAVAPSIRSTTSREQFATFIREHLEQDKDFEIIAGSMAKILRTTKLNDTILFNRFWSKMERLLRSRMASPAKTVRLTQDYLSFVRANAYTYRNSSFELTAKQILHSYVRNYQAGGQPCVIYPSSVAKALAFIIAFGSPYEPVFCDMSEGSHLAMLDQFADSLRIGDWITIARGIEASMNLNSSRDRDRDRRRYARRYLEQMLNFIAVLDEGLTAKLVGPEAQAGQLTPTELHLIAKSELCVKKGGSDSPVFQEAMRQLVQCSESRPELFNSRLYKTVTISLLATLYNVPVLIDRMRDYIAKHEDTVAPDFVVKFVYLAYSLGYESNDVEFFRKCYEIISKYWATFSVLELLQAMQALCYYRALSSELVHNVFSMDFLNQVDEELATVPSSQANHALKLRTEFMQLNRSVCLELPEAAVPWFHEKFCQDLRAAGGTGSEIGATTHIHDEVYTTLSEVLNNPDFIQRDAVTPYAYNIDFLIEFDERGRPVKKNPRRRSLFSFGGGGTSKNLASMASKSSAGAGGGERVAVLVMNDRSYTKNTRSLRGLSRLKVRHLEMLGYRVILVDPHQWNSMYMSEQAVRNEFLEQCIYARTVGCNS